MDNSDRLELKRQAFHLFNGLAIATAVYVLKPVISLWILAPLLAALLIMYYVPNVKPGLKLANHLLYHFERREDIKAFPFKGAIYYGIGLIFPILLLDVRYGCAVILIFSVGDCFSTLFGRKYGRKRIGGKSLEGAVAFLLTSWPSASVLVNPTHALVLALVGSVVELSDFIDDNITVPAVLSLLALLLQQ
ncbi:MAG: hypothetical protein V1744_03410 [Candidatus Altiarchaeota archaeon]